MRLKIILYLQFIFLLMTCTDLALAQKNICDARFLISKNSNQEIAQTQQDRLRIFRCIVDVAHSIDLSNLPFTMLPISDPSFLTIRFDDKCEHIKHLIKVIPDHCAGNSTTALTLVEMDDHVHHNQPFSLEGILQRDELMSQHRYKRKDCIVDVVFYVPHNQRASININLLAKIFIDSLDNAVSDGYLDAPPPPLSFIDIKDEYHIYMQYRFDCDLKQNLTDELLRTYILPLIPYQLKYKVISEGLDPNIKTIDVHGAWWTD